MDVKRNLTMLCDYYELTMGNGYLKAGIGDRIVYFDVFYRNNPDNGGYAIAAGLEQVIEYIENLKFTDEDIEFLRSKGCFCEEFLEYLRNFKFTGDIWAIPEGTVVFPSEPLMVVKAPAIEAQFIETYVLMMINHQSLIATKASRLTRAAKGRAVYPRFTCLYDHSIKSATITGREIKNVSPSEKGSGLVSFANIIPCTLIRNG